MSLKPPVKISTDKEDFDIFKTFIQHKVSWHTEEGELKKRIIFARLTAIVLSLAALLLSTGPALSEPQTTLRIVPTPVCAVLNEPVQVVVRIEDVTNLWAYHVEMTFTPNTLEVLSVENGSFLQDGITLGNADSSAGRFYFANTQVGSEVPPASGSGELVIITFLPLNDNTTTPLVFDTLETRLVLSDLSTAIPYQAINTVVTTGECVTHSVYLPIIFR